MKDDLRLELDGNGDILVCPHCGSGHLYHRRLAIGKSDYFGDYRSCPAIFVWFGCKDCSAETRLTIKQCKEQTYITCAVEDHAPLVQLARAEHEPPSVLWRGDTRLEDE